MKKLSELFSRFTNFIPPERILKERIIIEIKNQTGIEIEKQNIKIERGVVRVSVSPAVKIRILIKKERIMENLRDELKDNTPNDII